MGYLGVIGRAVLCSSLLGVNGCGGDAGQVFQFAARAQAAIMLAWVTTFSEPSPPPIPEPLPSEKCPNCNGTGEIGDGAGISVECPECDGTGKVNDAFSSGAKVNETFITVSAPATVCENGVCRLAAPAERSVMVQGQPVRNTARVIVSSRPAVRTVRFFQERRPVRRFVGRLLFRRCR